MAKLREGQMVGLLQMAIDKVKYGKDPEDWNCPNGQDQWDYYNLQVKLLQETLNEVGPDAFSKMTFDIDYNYEDEDDED